MSLSTTMTQLPSPIRGDARDLAVARLAELDRMMLAGARTRRKNGELQAYVQEAAAQLLPFRDRMLPDAYDHAVEAAVDRLIRDHERLPTLAFE